MRFLHIGKDGGPDSTVTGYWLVEMKRLFSIALLRFGEGSREEYHSHAFHCLSWVLSGKLVERHLDGKEVWYRPSWLPVVTKRSTFHRVVSKGTTWVVTFRGPWARKWAEYSPRTRAFSTLSDGRRVVEAMPSEGP